MGTNYYLKNSENISITLPSGESTGVQELHIGKSSGGWCFSLHVQPELGIHDLDDWTPLLADPTNHIENEYGDDITCEELLETITQRKWDPPGWNKPLDNRFYAGQSWDDFFASNHAEPGPHGLLRHRVEELFPDTNDRSSFSNGCIKHGEGTWDCIVGDFS